MARRPDAKPDLVVALDGQPDAAVDEPAFEQGAGRRRSPAAVDGGARRALEPRVSAAPGARRATLSSGRPARASPKARADHERPAVGGEAGRCRSTVRRYRPRARLPPPLCDATAPRRMPLTEDDRSGAALPARGLDRRRARPPIRCSWSTGCARLAGRAAPTLDDLDLELNARRRRLGHGAQRRREDHAAADHRRARGPRTAAACTSRDRGWATTAAPTSARSDC